MADEAREEPFPAAPKTLSGMVNSVPTEVSCTHFSDKVMVTISQGGRLAQWVQVPLSAPSSASVDMAPPSGGGGLGGLPATHLTPQTLLGGGGEGREMIGQLYASQIATHLLLKRPDERRTLLLGLGLEHVQASRDAFFDVVELVHQVT